MMASFVNKGRIKRWPTTLKHKDLHHQTAQNALWGNHEREDLDVPANGKL
jgi:hypothetical protein